MKRIVVATASKHGATGEIGERVGAGLRAKLGPGVAVDVCEAGATLDVASYDAAVIGSAVYLGRWLKPARDLVSDNAVQLQRRPVWFFSSGPVGDVGRHDDVPPTPDWVRGHKIFGGKITRATLNLPERVVTGALHVGDGDFRDVVEIDAWVGEIVGELGWG